MEKMEGTPRAVGVVGRSRAALMSHEFRDIFTNYVRDLAIEHKNYYQSLDISPESARHMDIEQFCSKLDYHFTSRKFLQNESGEDIKSVHKNLFDKCRGYVQGNEERFYNIGVGDSLGFATRFIGAMAIGLRDEIKDRYPEEAIESDAKIVKRADFKKLMNIMAQTGFGFYGNTVFDRGTRDCNNIAKKVGDSCYGVMALGDILDFDSLGNFQLKTKHKKALVNKMREQNKTRPLSAGGILIVSPHTQTFSTSGCPVARNSSGEPTGIDIWCDFVADQYTMFKKQASYSAVS